MMNFGEWIKRTMLEKGIAEETAYTRAGMTQPNWSRLVNSPPLQPRKSTMQAVARGLDEPLAKVYGAAGYDDNVEMDVRLARQIEPYLTRVPLNKRPQAERMLIEQARQLSELFAA